MLTIEVELLHGTIRAGESNDLAMTGADSRGEWPPSPARLVAALVAGDGTRDRCRVTDGTELRVLERAAPPIIHADPTDDVARSRLRERFVVVNDKAKSAVQDYPGRTNGVERPGTRLSPRHPRLAYVWPDVEVDEDTMAALRSRAARVGYLGCADSPVRLRVHDGPPSSAPATTRRPDPSGEATLPVPFDGYVEVLDAAYDMFTAGTSARRSWFRSEHARYASPTPTSVASPSREGTMVALRFERPVSGRRVLTVTETLREAVLDLYQRLVAAEGEELPAVLHGHATPVGSQHAHFLALPDVGHEHARGRIHGAAIWLPPHAGADVVEGVRQVVWNLTELVRPGALEVRVHPWSGESRPWAVVPRRWYGPARRWVTAFPVIHERYVRPHPGLAHVAEWSRHAGIEAPLVDVEQSRVPLIPGAASLHPREALGTRYPRMPYSHMRLTFDRPVTGPVFIGRGRQFGLGLCVPDDPPATEDGDRRG
ncbi:MAG: type I-U CRISPR-associated protein Csb2 [Acidimicrobiia bacterium]